MLIIFNMGKKAGSVAGVLALQNSDTCRFCKGTFGKTEERLGRRHRNAPYIKPRRERGLVCNTCTDYLFENVADKAVYALGVLF